MKNLQNRVIQFCDWLDINRPKEIFLRTIFAGFLICLGACLSIFMLSLVLTTTACITNEISEIPKGITGILIGLAAITLCKRLRIIGKQKFEFDRLEHLMSTMYIQTDATVEFLLKQIYTTNDIWERHQHQKDLAKYLVGNEEWAGKYWRELDERTKYYIQQLTNDNEKANYTNID